MGVTELNFDLLALKAKIKAVFNGLCYCYGNLSAHKKMSTFWAMIELSFSTIIVAALDKEW